MSSSNTRRSALTGAAFLMATSAIGPGFITQTTVFTEKLKSSFGFVILCSVLLDIVIQLTIWRVITVSGLRAQDLANRIVPSSGYVLSILIVIGGLAFNVGNIAGAALGLNVLAGLSLPAGALISAIFALIIFWSKEAGSAMDLIAKILGFVMIALTGYVAVVSHPPVAEALYRSFVPEVIDTNAIIILVGGTVGGYISFAGAHRLLDASITGQENLSLVSAGSVRAIILASTMRVLLFLAALGVVVANAELDPANPAASVFRIASGALGYRIFGLVLWCAAITSVIGSAYTSTSFLKGYNQWKSIPEKFMIVTFILISLIIFLIVGRPVKVLVVVGALNGFILPFALVIMLIAAHRRSIVGKYSHPRWLAIATGVAVLLLSVISLRSFYTDLFNW